MTLNDVMTVILRYFTDLVNTCVPTHNRVDLWRNLCTSLLYFVVRARCRRKESSCSLSHLLMSFLFLFMPLSHPNLHSVLLSRNRRERIKTLTQRAEWSLLLVDYFNIRNKHVYSPQKADTEYNNRNKNTKKRKIYI